MISRPTKKYLNILSEYIEKTFLVGEKEYGDDPKTYINEAMPDINPKKWLKAMKSMIDSMYSNKYGSW